MNQPFLNSVGLLVIGSGLTFLAAWYWHLKNAAVAEKNAAIAEALRLKAEHDRLVARVTEIESSNAVLKAAVVPITSAFQALLVKQLTHFHTPLMDSYLEKIGHLTEKEEGELARLLEERVRDAKDEIPDSESRAARILPDVMVLAKREMEMISQDSTLSVVSVPGGSGESKPQPQPQPQEDKQKET